MLWGQQCVHCLACGRRKEACALSATFSRFTLPYHIYWVFKENPVPAETFVGTDQGLLERLPHCLRDEFPAVLTHRSGITPGLHTMMCNQAASQ